MSDAIYQGHEMSRSPRSDPLAEVIAERDFIQIERAQLQARIAGLEAERDTLLTACKEALAAIPERSPVRPIVEAAIARAEGRDTSNA